MKALKLTLILIWIKLSRSDWDLAWNEEFNENQLDNNKWIIKHQEDGCYDRDETPLESNACFKNDTKNLRLIDGNLVISLHKTQIEGEYTSGSIETTHEFNLRSSGKLTIRAAMADGATVWTEFCLNFDKSCKILINYYKNEPGENMMGTPGEGIRVIGSHIDFYDFNVYGIQWNETAISFSLNSMEIFSKRVSQRLNSSLNKLTLDLLLGVGGHEFEEYTTQFDWLCSSLIVDYIRYYQWIEDYQKQNNANNEKETSHSSRDQICAQISEWSLEWSQEFNDNQVDEREIMFMDNLDQCEQSKSPCLAKNNQTIQLFNGSLVMSIVRQDDLDRYTSSQFQTHQRLSLGKYEIRAAQPRGEFVWSRIMLSSGSGCVNSIIIDYSTQPKPIIKTQIFSYRDECSQTKQMAVNEQNLDDFHVYSIEINRREFILKIDSKPYSHINFAKEIEPKTFNLKVVLGADPDSEGNHLLNYTEGLEKLVCPTLIIDYIRYYRFSNQKPSEDPKVGEPTVARSADICSLMGYDDHNHDHSHDHGQSEPTQEKMQYNLDLDSSSVSTFKLELRQLYLIIVIKAFVKFMLLLA